MVLSRYLVCDVDGGDSWVIRHFSGGPQRQEASYSSRYRALYRALTDVIIPQSDNFEMHAISTILSKKEQAGTKSETMSQYFHLSDIRTEWFIRNRISL